MNIKRRLSSLLVAAALLSPGAARAFTLMNGLSFADQYGGLQYSQSIGTVTAPMQIARVDTSYQLAFATYSVAVAFPLAEDDTGADVSANIEISTDDFATSVPLASAGLVISSYSAYSQPFRMRVTGGLTGSINVYVMSPTWLGGSIGSIYIDVLGNIAFSGVSIRNDPAGTAGLTTTITPDRDGVQDAAIIRGQLSGLPYWQILIYSTASGPSSPLYTLYADESSPEAYWYGYDMEGRVVPNGAYNVRLQAVGGSVVDDSLTVTVNTSYIEGVVVSTPSLSYLAAMVNVYGPGGGGSYETSSDDGYFRIQGLTAGQQYGVQIAADGYVSKSIPNVAAGTSIGAIGLEQGATLHVAAQRTMGAGSTDDLSIWGYLSANTTDYAQNAYGTVHFNVEVSTSDNGDWYSPSSFTVLGVPPGRTLSLRLELPQYGVFTRQVTSPAAGQTMDVFFASTEVVKQPVMGGAVILPSPAPPQGQWVSIDGTKQGQTQPSVFGGAWFDAGETNNPYQVFGVSAGTWTFRTHTQGFKSTSTVVNVSGDFTVVFSLETGGVITGTMTFLGDSSDTPVPSGYNPCSPGSGQIPVNIGAWSQSTFSGAWTTVCVATGTATTSSTYTLTGLDDGTYEVFTHLAGFQLTPPGRRTAAVSGGAGSLDIDYQRLSGALDLLVLYSTATDSAASLGYSVRTAFGGPDEFDASGLGLTDPGGGPAGKVFTGLGTGLYEVVVQNRNPGRGLIKRAAVNVVNGATSTVTLDMRNETNTTYSIDGQVSISGSIVLPAPWSVSVSSAAGLQAAVASSPEVQIFSFPLPENFSGNVNPYRKITAVPVAGQTYATFTVTGLLPGAYLLRVADDLNPPSNGGDPSLPELASTNQVVFLGTAGVSGVNITVSNGVTVGGSFSGEDTTPRDFELYLRRNDNLTVLKTTLTVVSGSDTFLFQHVSDGEYILEARERAFPPRFAAAPARVTVAGAAVTNAVIALQRAGTIVGQLRDADSNTLITSENVGQYLSNNFGFYARANPWVPGGHSDMTRCYEIPGGCNGSFNGGVYISSVTGQFSISRLVPGTVYDVVFRGFEGFDAGSASQGQKAYMPVSISGVRVAEGQTVDLGVVDLNQGVTLSGAVTLSGSTTPLANVPVVAFPSQLDGGERHDLAVQSFTDEEGNYTLQGVDRERRYYDVIAAPRPERGDARGLLSGVRYGEETRRNVDVTLGAAVDFTLTPANGILTGSVATADGGPLQMPAFGDGGGSGFSDRRAVVTLHLEGSLNAADNPLGEIEEVTDVQGNFRVEGLKPGTYTMRVISVGYVTDRRTVLVSAGANSAGTVTLTKGAALSGNITKPDGSAPSTDEVKFIVGVDQDFQEFVFAGLTANESANQVTAYTLDGFKTGLPYTLVSVSEEDDIIELASNIVFTASTETKTLDVVYKPSPPAVFVTQSRSGNTYNIRFFSTHKLRNLTADDNDLSLIVTCPTCGGGTGSVNISSSAISGSRDTVDVVYDAVANETSFRLRLAFTSAKVDAETGTNFTYDNTFEFFAGVDRVRIVRIANTVGGTCSLEGSGAGGVFPGGTFDVAGSSSVDVGVLTATSTNVGSQAFAAPAAQGRARAAGMAAAAQRLGPAAYPSQALYKAVLAAPNVAGTVFSNFYNVFLPAGVSHTLKKEALITLKYSDSVTDPSGLNIYYFDPGNDIYLLEDTKRQVDTVNKTITVAVRHLSTFVVLSNNAPAITGDSYVGSEVTAHNFPNPFDLSPKTVTLSRPGSSSAAQSVQGTMIRVGVPSNMSGNLRIEIYDAAGALVRDFSKTVTGGTFAYTEWDGKNDGGKNVASGVYVARVTINDGNEKFFKLAVLK